jgi:hypothetical protein
MDVCKQEVPALIEEDFAHASACHLSLEDKRKIAASEVVGGR